MGAPLGNNNAGKAKIWEQALSRAARPKDLQEIAEMVVMQAKNGQQWAVQEIGNRLDGKPMQPVEHKHETMPQTLSEAYLAYVAAGGKPDEYAAQTEH